MFLLLYALLSLLCSLTFQSVDLRFSEIFELMQIVSPGYPYDASVPCDYILSVETGKRVKLEVGLVYEKRAVGIAFVISASNTRGKLLL